MSTINTSITHAVTLSSSGSYASPLTITSDGAVNSPTSTPARAAIDGTIASAYVLNQGSITNDVPTYGYFGILLTNGGTVVNSGATARISAYQGVKITGTAGFVDNSGTILGTNVDKLGVYLTAGGTILNSGSLGGVDLFGGGYISISSTGTVTGHGLFVGQGATTIVNAGAVIGGDYGGGASGINSFTGVTTITNTGSIAGTGASGVGIRLGDSGTITNAGTISGSGGTAIAFGGSGDSRLVLEHNYAIGGLVTVAGTNNTLELLGAAGAVSVTLNDHGLTNFNTVLFSASNTSDETLVIRNTSGTVPVIISGLTSNHDIIDLTGIGSDGHVTNLDTVTHQVTVSGSNGTVVLQLDASDSTAFTTASDGGSGTDLSIACFCRGTQILTPDGEMPVEGLQIGTSVVTLSGKAVPIKWIGHRSYDRRFTIGNAAVLPIQIAAGAFGECAPARDLFVSPEHGFYFDGLLVAARLLVNGNSIRQVQHVENLEYFHIELDAHDILFAEGIPAESYAESNNRGMFRNAGDFAALYPGDDAPSFCFCAPRIEEASPELAGIKARLTNATEERKAA